MKMKTRFN